jgi:hypothetical protein
MKLCRVILSILLILPFVASAQTVAPHRPDAVRPEQRAALINSLHHGSAFAHNGQKYHHLPGAQATSRPQGETLAATAARLGVTTGDIIDTKGPYVLYRLTRGSMAAAVQTRDQKVTYPVAINTGTGQIGFMPGTIEVELGDVSQAAAIASSHGLELDRSFPHLGLAYFKVAGNGDIVAAAAAVAADKRVKRAEPEVITHVRVPR